MALVRFASSHTSNLRMEETVSTLARSLLESLTSTREDWSITSSMERVITIGVKLTTPTMAFGTEARNTGEVSRSFTMVTCIKVTGFKTR